MAEKDKPDFSTIDPSKSSEIITNEVEVKSGGETVGTLEATKRKLAKKSSQAHFSDIVSPHEPTDSEISSEHSPNPGTACRPSTSAIIMFSEGSLRTPAVKFVKPGSSSSRRLGKTCQRTGSKSYPLLKYDMQIENVDADLLSQHDSSSFGDSLALDPPSIALRWQCPVCEHLLPLKSEEDSSPYVCSNCGHVFDPLPAPTKPSQQDTNVKMQEIPKEEKVVSRGNCCFVVFCIVAFLLLMFPIILAIFSLFVLRHESSSENERNVTDHTSDDNVPSPE